MSCRAACAKRLMICFGGFFAANAAATTHFAIATIFRTCSTTIAGVTCFMQA
jgi:hypothetical protein